VSTTLAYDDVDRLTSTTSRDAANLVLFQYDYFYDPAGHLLRTDRNGLQQAEFGYNAAGWLIDAEYATGQDLHYSYDPVGNRRQQDDGGNVTTYDYNAEDRVLTQTLPSLNTIAYSYDANGNVIQTHSSWGDVFYAYDFENQLRKITYPVPYDQIGTFYSVEGQRLARDERGQTTFFYPTLKGVVVELDAAGQTTTRLNPSLSLGPGSPPLARDKARATPEAFVHWDGQGSTIHFTNAAAGEVAAFDFGYFGEMLSSSGDVDGVDPGLYTNNQKVDWDPMLGAELIGGDYAPDIDQHFGGYLFDPDDDLSRQSGPGDAWWYDHLVDGAPYGDYDIGDKSKGTPRYYPPDPLFNHCDFQGGIRTRLATRCKPKASDCTKELAQEIIKKSDLEKIYQKECDGKWCPKDDAGCQLICKVEILWIDYSAKTGIPAWCDQSKLTPTQIRKCIGWVTAEKVCDDMGWILCRLYAEFHWRCECKKP
jgi:YD repeat-containing protein